MMYINIFPKFDHLEGTKRFKEIFLLLQNMKASEFPRKLNSGLSEGNMSLNFSDDTAYVDYHVLLFPLIFFFLFLLLLPIILFPYLFNFPLSF